ncbi:MAG: HEAT repeat domain-containing protein, partial [Verrucomicrobiales bacterium]|nr:HEAT repeat domain-containing protein [Verrucomicrobiales bacterium]
DALRRAADDESTSVRFAALQTLWRIHPDSDAAVDAALEALDDTDPGVRGTALSRLSRYAGPRIAEVRQALDSRTRTGESAR